MCDEVCGKKPSNMPFPLCGGCKKIQYCSDECRRKDWPRHRSVCDFWIARKKEYGAAVSAFCRTFAAGIASEARRYSREHKIAMNNLALVIHTSEIRGDIKKGMLKRANGQLPTTYERVSDMDAGAQKELHKILDHTGKFILIVRHGHGLYAHLAIRS